MNDAVELLKRLIATPSVSRNETAAADIMEKQMITYGLAPHREANNVWVLSSDWDDAKPTLLLNAHIDTVKPVDSWTRDPFKPTLEGDKLYGLGSNDCGGGLTTLLQVFRWLSLRPQPYNYVYLVSAEEEVSGKDGFSRALPLLPKIDTAIVGEPTGMQPAIAEKGLMVLDVLAHGKSGHAARNEGVNAIYEALDDMVWIRDYKFQKVSPLLGPTKMTLTVVHAGTQHNVIPDQCTMLVDCAQTNTTPTRKSMISSGSTSRVRSMPTLSVSTPHISIPGTRSSSAASVSASSPTAPRRSATRRSCRGSRSSSVPASRFVPTLPMNISASAK